jgi:hypothetical protein
MSAEEVLRLPSSKSDPAITCDFGQWHCAKLDDASTVNRFWQMSMT